MLLIEKKQRKNNMNRNDEKKKEIRDNKYWHDALEAKKVYAEKEEQWKKDLLKANPETPKPYVR